MLGNLAYPQFARSLITPEIDAVFHLASLVSGGAEQNFELGTKVNLDATRDLLEACRLAGHCPKFIFASSIAVYSEVDEVTDETPAAPRLSYGAQKLVCEILIDDYTRRGYIDGRALRLPTVMVRPGSANTAVSGWASAIIREPLAGRDYVCPVRPDTRMACISLRRVVDAFVRISELPPAELGTQAHRAADRHPGLRGTNVGRGEAQGQRSRCASSRIRRCRPSWTGAEGDLLQARRETRAASAAPTSKKSCVSMKKLPSRITVEGLDRAPHRAFLHALGLKDC